MKIVYWRYGLEMVSVPIFAFLVWHLSGHGLEGITGGFLEEVLPMADLVLGALGLVFFVWVWHRPVMKKFVPCSHDHCHHKTIWPHLGAMVAFAFHLFPESAIRHEFISTFDSSLIFTFVGIVGFLSHFLVDVIIALLLSSFWPRLKEKVLSFFILALVWVIALKTSGAIFMEMSHLAESGIMLVSAFLLAMFVHTPHKPKKACTTCTH